ncbi:hypothetical protein V1264_014335 [Littorina saxatilis]
MVSGMIPPRTQQHSGHHRQQQQQQQHHHQQLFSSHLYSCLLGLLVLFCSVQTTFPCPRDCFCEPHSKNVHCTNKGLTSIPENIPDDTVELILNQNTFHNPDLTRRNFTNLMKLQKLYMSRCGIETIALDTFSDLSDLVWLDISNNKITFLADYTFRGLHLKHLFINDNKGIQLSSEAFEGMSTQGMYMHNCGISKLSVKVMSPLNGTLRTLWLYQNDFESFSEEWLYLFNTLGHLRLGRNPFHCNCEIGWLQKFFSKHNSVFSGGELPSCSTPALVRNKPFSNLTADDFRCELPTFRNVDAVFDREMGKLTCQARGDPTPTLYWIRPDGTTETYYSTPGEDTDQNEGVMYMTNVKLTDSARYKCVASNPAGNVTFSLNVVWPSTPTTLTPPQAPKDNVIVADATSQPSGRQFRDEAAKGKKYDGGDWQVNQPGMKLGSKVEEGGQGGADGVRRERGKGEVRFSMVDIVGAVVGTFLLTVLLCVLFSQLYWRRKERLRQEQEDHYSVPDSKPPLAPARLYIMGEDGENRVRMLNNHAPHTECPT